MQRRAMAERRRVQWSVSEPRCTNDVSAGGDRRQQFDSRCAIEVQLCFDLLRGDVDAALRRRQ